MKIVGKTAEGFLVNMSGDEVANVIGYSYEYCDDIKKAKIEIKPGLIFSVHKEYENLLWIRYHQQSLLELAKKLRSTADSLELARPEIKDMVEKVSA